MLEEEVGDRLSGNDIEENKGKKHDFVAWLSDLTPDNPEKYNKEIQRAGSKAVNLSRIMKSNFPVPAGFVITKDSYNYFLEKNNLRGKISDILREIELFDLEKARGESKQIKCLIENAEMPEEIASQIVDSYEVLDVGKKEIQKAGVSALDILRSSHEPPFLAVRSSVISEKENSFAGQHESFLNIKGEKELLECVKKCFASLFNLRALAYRKKKNISEFPETAVIVQRMIDSEKSGSVFSGDFSEKENNILIESAFGLGNGISSGEISPDSYVLDKGLQLVERKISDKKIAIVRTGAGRTEAVRLTHEKNSQESLNGYEIKRIAQFAKDIEKLFGRPIKADFSVSDREFYFLQADEISQRKNVQAPILKGLTLATGMTGISSEKGFVTGKVALVRQAEDLPNLEKGELAVMIRNSPEISLAFGRISGVVSEGSGVSCNASTLAREFGIPCIVNSLGAIEKIKEGEEITIDAYSGRIIRGRAELKQTEFRKIVPSKTEVGAIVESPSHSREVAEAGAREAIVKMEDIISLSGKHPASYLREDNLRAYADMLYSSLRRISAEFEKVFTRTSKINPEEHEKLEGSPEKRYKNPIMGSQGARFLLRNLDLLESEIKAVKDVADEFPDKEFGIALGHVVSEEEWKSFKNVVDRMILPKNVKLGFSIDTPAAVQILNSLCDSGADFVGIDIESLAQYTLAVDRKDEDAEDIYSIHSPAVINSIKYSLRRCSNYKIPGFIYTQDEIGKDFLGFLIRQKAEKIFVLPSFMGETSEKTAKIEGIDARDIENNRGAGVSDEELILKALEKGDITSDNAKSVEEIMQLPLEKIKTIMKSEVDEYMPGFFSGKNRNDEMPSLNDAIPVDSTAFEKQEREKSIEINREESEEENDEPEETWDSIPEQDKDNEKDEYLDIF